MQPQSAPISSPALSDSRFHMWRAVFALAHADGRVTQQEADFMKNYISVVPLTGGQKEILQQDIVKPQSLNAMLIGISKPEDMADFFQFAQMLCWCDGDYEAQERTITERLTAEQMNKFNKQEIAQQIREARAAATLRRSIEDAEFKRQAKEAVGLGSFGKRMIGDAEYRKNSLGLMKMTGANIFKTLFGKGGGIEGIMTGKFEKGDADLHKVMEWMRVKSFDAPDGDMFALWRAVLALIHADGVVSPLEEDYIKGMMSVFMFSEDQRRVLRHDMKQAQDIPALFDAIQGDEHRRRFFALARTIIWCDGEFHDREREIMNALKNRLGANAAAYKAELEWLDKKPAMPANASRKPKETAMKGLFGGMVRAYQELKL